MTPKIKSVEPLPDRVLLVSFDDGRLVRFEPTEYLAGYAGYDVFSVAPGLFNLVKIDRARQHVYWTDVVSLPGSLIYTEGQIVAE